MPSLPESFAGREIQGFYDVKNARLTDRKAGHEHATVREPLIDMIKFSAFCAIVHSLLKAGQGDVVWILAGKTDSNMQKIRKKITELGWKFKAIHLIYDWRNQQKWYFKKMRGMANSKTYEKALLCWKGKFPTGLPKDRQYVDAGSALYCDTMLKVPVLPQGFDIRCWVGVSGQFEDHVWHHRRDTTGGYGGCRCCH